MKILILGDSFADDTVKQVECCSYIDQLRQDYTVDNLAVSGSNLVYSYRLYQRHKNCYDKILVFVTDRGRLRLPKNIYQELYQDKDRQPWNEFVPNIRTIDGRLETETLASRRHLLHLARQYYLFLANTEDDTSIQEALVQGMQAANTLCIPCFRTSWHAVEFAMIDWCNGRLTWPDLRCCHLEQYQHDEMALRLRHWIRTGLFTLGPAA